MHKGWKHCKGVVTTAVSGAHFPLNFWNVNRFLRIVGNANNMTLISSITLRAGLSVFPLDMRQSSKWNSLLEIFH